MRAPLRKLYVLGALGIFFLALGLWMVRTHLKSVELLGMRRDIFASAQIGMPHEVRQMLDAGIDPNTREPSRFDEGERNWWEYLGFGSRRSVAYDMQARIVLDAAVQNEKHRYEMVKLLLDRGSKIRSAREYPTTPLWVAASAGDVETTKLLLDRGADINDAPLGDSTPSLATPLEGAVYSGGVKTVKLLLERGARVSGKENIGTGFAKYGMYDPPDADQKEILAMLAKAKAAQEKRSRVRGSSK